MHDHDRGLAFDLSRLVGRRGMLGLVGGAVLVGAVGCTQPETQSGTGVSAGSTGSAGGQEEIPDETAGPFPGDGSNGPDALTQSGVVRQDIRSSFGSSAGVAEGIPLTVEFTVLDGGSAYAGAAIYLWHCDREGRYSMYSDGVTEENYLRGVQEAGPDGLVRFTTIFPGAYAGRWPHLHFQVYANLQEAVSASDGVKVTQLAFPEQACAEAYAAPGYEQSAANLPGLSLDDDSVFRDGYEAQLATVTGDAGNGYTAKLDVRV
ncbi:hypothetical protein Aph01nite_16500 [Acrocarpospora phusangensis]|uniref:Intradiol ring-cleavage dioxygenases domain-containing protein n=1 Tax=Acrocarpospora phusangensis TaxID=1070424 RepID=A0A919Q9R9_9ACTN|nr:hypothetical protein [Acrocarpospora phusangensis]GIH23340.1 hypothetical protein Aph01nite_16500 [Acrocarpospora phusangensis]